MTEEEFQSYWLKVHAVQYASKIPQIKRYMIDTRVDYSGDKGEPLYSGLAEIWLENEAEQLASLQTKEFLEGARLDEPRWAAFWKTLVLDTDAHLVTKGDAFRYDTSGVKLVMLLKRREGLSLANFRSYSLGIHSSLVLRVPGLERSMQNHTRDSWYYLGEPRFDSVEQLWFKDLGALEDAIASEQFLRLRQDMLQFAEQRWIFSFAMREHWIIGPEAR